MNEPYFFIAYARQDIEVVQTVVSRLKDVGIATWMDLERLKPGESWDESIRDALEGAVGMLVFVSTASMKSQSVNLAVQRAAQGTDYLIIPIFLERVDELPHELLIRHGVDLTGGASADAIDRLVYDVVRAVRRATVRTPTKISATDATRFASQVAAEARGHTIEQERESGHPDAAFVVHGSDHNLLGEVEAFLVAHNVKAVVLTRVLGAEQSLFQKFLRWGEAARFAIVLLSADDLGASRVQYEQDGVGERALQFRARQNAILELGFFYGRLGWENVFVLLRPPNKIFPNFERPSDLDGVLFDQVDPEGNWKKLLTDRLRAARFALADPAQPV